MPGTNPTLGAHTVLTVKGSTVWQHPRARVAAPSGTCGSTLGHVWQHSRARVAAPSGRPSLLRYSPFSYQIPFQVNRDILGDGHPPSAECPCAGEGNPKTMKRCSVFYGFAMLWKQNGSRDLQFVRDQGEGTLGTLLCSAGGVKGPPPPPPPPNTCQTTSV